MLPVGFEKMNVYGRKRIPFFFIIDYRAVQPLVIPFQEVSGNGILFQFHSVSNVRRENRPQESLILRKYPISYPVYSKSFQIVMDHIKRGDSYLVNLTFPTPIETNLTLSEIFHRSHTRYKLLVDDQYLVFSPESFIQIVDGKIYSYPMKGTIDADIPDSKKRILEDPKELAEHHTIVDLIRNDLSMVSKKVRVERFRYIESIDTNFKTLLQVSSKISGILPKGFQYRIGEILFQLLPAGSISGAPKKKTVEIIEEAEIYERGYYTGIMGYFDGSSLDSSVMIRFIEKTSSGLIFKSGGGITCFSNPETEYQEMIDKVYVPFN